MKRSVMQVLYASGAAALLAGRGDGDVQEARDWMKQVERETVPKVKPLPEPKMDSARCVHTSLPSA